MACVRTNIYELVGESSVLSLVTLLAPLVFGVYWKRTTSTGAMISMISGFTAWVVFEFVITTEFPSLIPATIISTVGLLAGSLLTVKPTDSNESVKKLTD